MIEVKISGADALVGEDTGVGALDPEQVWIQFVCTTGPGQHDPEAAPDERVRPHHAALHGTLWRLDDLSAPIPPLDYGCRCAIRYVAAPGKPAASVLPEADGEPEASVEPAFVAYLDEHAPQWRRVREAAVDAPIQQQANAAYAAARELGYSRDIARMAIQAQPIVTTRGLDTGLGWLSGVGAAGRRLAERWLAGDAAAGLELRAKYPATWSRLAAQRPGLLAA